MAVIYFQVIPHHFKCFATRTVKYIADAFKGILSDWDGWLQFFAPLIAFNGLFQGGSRVLESEHYCHVKYNW